MSACHSLVVDERECSGNRHSAALSVWCDRACFNSRPIAIGCGWRRHEQLGRATFEFTGTFPAGWQSYDNIVRTPGTVYLLTYAWGTTTYTRTEGTRSAAAVVPNTGSAFLPGATYTDPVDSWMVFPLDLTRAWQARND